MRIHGRVGIFVHGTRGETTCVTSKSPVGDISVVTLIRTDTTLDHSQKAEKVSVHVHRLFFGGGILIDRAHRGHASMHRPLRWSTRAAVPAGRKGAACLFE